MDNSESSRIINNNSLATMFTALVTSFVSDIVLPPISVLLPLNKNLEEKFAVLRSGANHPEEGYNTLKQAQADGAVVMAYGYVITFAAYFHYPRSRMNIYYNSDSGINDKRAQILHEPSPQLHGRRLLAVQHRLHLPVDVQGPHHQEDCSLPVLLQVHQH
nr:large-conductance mechanosensitive channel related protein [imported] - Neurospora crassa [Neurospora crassa]